MPPSGPAATSVALSLSTGGFLEGTFGLGSNFLGTSLFSTPPSAGKLNSLDPSTLLLNTNRNFMPALLSGRSADSAPCLFAPTGFSVPLLIVFQALSSQRSSEK